MMENKGTALTEELVVRLQTEGFNRWQKNGNDRLYVNARDLGLECEYYNSGNIHNAWFLGEHISNSEAARMKAAKTYIDVATGVVYGDNQTLKDAAADKLARVIADVAEVAAKLNLDIDLDSDSDPETETETETETDAEPEPEPETADSSTRILDDILTVARKAAPSASGSELLGKVRCFSVDDVHAFLDRQQRIDRGGRTTAATDGHGDSAEDGE